MSYYSGRDGSLFLGDQRVAKVANWSLSSNVEALETTSLGDNERNYTPGLKSATGSASIFYYDEAPSALLAHVIQTGAVTDVDDMVGLSLRWGDKRIDVDVYLTSAQLQSQVGAVMQASISFQVSGDYQQVVL